MRRCMSTMSTTETQMAPNDHKNRNETDTKEENKKEEQGEHGKVARRRVFNICFQGNQPTIPRLRHLLS